LSFDPFGDFETKGYLRNILGLKDAVAVKRGEHRAFRFNLPVTLEQIAGRREISYEGILTVHKTLFSSLYPWAGQDRAALAPSQVLSKGGFAFAYPRAIRDVAEHALERGHDRAHIRSRPGHLLGELAYAHPFLDGNGRTILVVFNELAHRAGMSIDWLRGDKTAWLDALTRQILAPESDALDSYLGPLIRRAAVRGNHAGRIPGAPGPH
jgi:cell filamentation protein